MELKDEVGYEVVVRDVILEVGGAGEVVGVVVNELDVEVVQSDVVIVDLVSSIIVDTEVTALSIESYVHTYEGFSRGHVDRSVLTGRVGLEQEQDDP